MLLPFWALLGRRDGTHKWAAINNIIHIEGISGQVFSKLLHKCLCFLSAVVANGRQNKEMSSYMSPNAGGGGSKPMIQSPYFKRLWSPGIDSKASVPPAYVARRAGTITLFLLGAKPPVDFLKIPVQLCYRPSPPWTNEL